MWSDAHFARAFGLIHVTKHSTYSFQQHGVRWATALRDFLTMIMLRRIDEKALIRNFETARRSRAVSNYESTLVSLLSDLNHDVIYYCPVHNNNTNRFVTLSILSKIELYYRQISSGDLNIAL